MYRLRQMDVDDKVCEQINPGIVETIYPKEVIEQCLQESVFLIVEYLTSFPKTLTEFPCQSAKIC